MRTVASLRCGDMGEEERSLKFNFMMPVLPAFFM
jgi:hypothetical protein